MISMLLDIPWFVEAIGLNSGQQSFAEARAAKIARTGVRVGRILRSARMVRMVRMVQSKLFKKWWEKRSQQQMQQPTITKQVTESHSNKRNGTLSTAKITPGGPPDKYSVDANVGEAGQPIPRSRSASVTHAETQSTSSSTPGQPQTASTISPAAVAAARERKTNEDAKKTAA